MHSFAGPVAAAWTDVATAITTVPDEVALASAADASATSEVAQQWAAAASGPSFVAGAAAALGLLLLHRAWRGGGRGRVPGQFWRAASALCLLAWATAAMLSRGLPLALQLAGLVLLAGAAWVLGEAEARRIDCLRRTSVSQQGRMAGLQQELQQAQVALRQAQDAAEAAVQAKAAFLALASHDLRQPAHALGLYVAALRAGELAPAQAQIAERLAAAHAALDALLSALLDVTRIDAGAVVPRWETVALEPLLWRLAQEWAPEAEARGLRLALRLPRTPPLSVSDPLLLERVLRNLLSNAVKYTHRGGVLLACRERRATDGSRMLRIEVWDSGDGIAPTEQERVFEAFYQIGNPGRDRSRGLGLGLAIVQRLVRLLQLRLELLSRPGRGSVFRIEGLLPAGPLPQRAALARLGERRLQGLTLAVLEDDAEVRDATVRLLQAWGCAVFAAADAPSLLQALPPGLPVHAVLADLRLADGLEGPQEAARLFQAWARPLPLLLLSGDAAPARQQDLHHSGHTLLFKPVPPPRLRAWLEQVAAQRSATDEGFAKP